jgi:tRNA dimethylallyltransferase
MAYFTMKKETQKNLKKVIVVVGPTSSGKSALGVRLAKKFVGEIISADSRQVYRGLDIGTGKITRREMEGIPHHLLDVAHPSLSYSAGRFQKDAEKCVRYIVHKGKVPIIVGGTGFYIDALVRGYSLPEAPADFKLRTRLGKKTPEALFKMLEKLDPARAKTIERKNKRRLIRAIEIAKSADRTPPLKTEKKYDAFFIGLYLPKETLRKKINVRVDARMRDGMIAEAKRLRRGGLSLRRMRQLGLDYRFLADYLDEKISKPELIQKIKTANWQYARRQITWFKRHKDIHWYTPSQYSAIEKQIKKFLSP